MIKTNELRGIIASNNYSQSDVAKMIGVMPKTFYEKMKTNRPGILASKIYYNIK